MNGENKIALGLAVLGLLLGGAALIFSLVGRQRLDEEAQKVASLRTALQEQREQLNEWEGLREDLAGLREQGREATRRANEASSQVEGIVRETERALQGFGRQVSDQLQALRGNLSSLAETVGDIERRVGALEESTPVAGTGTGTGTASRPSGDGEGGVHVIEPGDTLSGLARRYGVSLTALERANPDVNPNRLRVGQEIVIPE